MTAQSDSPFLLHSMPIRWGTYSMKLYVHIYIINDVWSFTSDPDEGDDLWTVVFNSILTWPFPQKGFSPLLTLPLHGSVELHILVTLPGKSTWLYSEYEARRATDPSYIIIAFLMFISQDGQLMRISLWYIQQSK
jgi:hypothetical protein